MKKENPIFSSMDNAYTHLSGKTATFGGISLKLIITTLFTLLGVGVNYVFPGLFNGFNQIFLLVALIIVQVMMIKAISSNPAKAKGFALIYSFILGLTYGRIIVFYGILFDGVVETALLSVVSIFLALILLYSVGIIRNGSMLRKITFTLGFGYMIFILVSLVFSLFGGGIFSFANPSFLLLISLVSAAISTLYLVQSIDSCNRLVYSGGPKEYEWTVALGLLANLLWLFIDLLRIFAIFANRD